MKHNLIISAFLLPLTVAGQWTYQGTYLGLDFPLDSVLVENLSQGGDITVPGEDSLGQVVVGVSDIAHPVTGGSALLPGRPNPFHTHTTFGLFIEKAGDATLMVFDATGRSITGLEVKNLAPGNHGFQFNGPHVGVYFVSCVTGGMRHVLRLVQLAGNGESDLHHTGTSTAQPKDGYRDTFPWTPGDVVRHTAYATLPCGAQARHVVVDVPDAIEHYSMPLTQVAPGDSPCLFTDRQSIELPAACVGGTSTQSFRLVGENLTCSTIPIGPVDGYTFALAGADPFQNTLAIPVDTDATVNDTIHVRFTPDDENGNITDLYLTCGSIQTTVHLLGTVSSTQAAGVLTGDQNICVGDSSTFSSSVSGGSWTSSDPDIATINANTGLVNGIAADTATMTYTVSTPGCADAIATLIVTVYPLPLAPTITGPTSFCADSSITLTSSSATGYLWSPGNQTTQGITVNAAGTYSVTVTSDDGCDATSAGTAVTVTPNQATPPSLPTVTQNEVLVASDPEMNRMHLTSSFTHGSCPVLSSGFRVQQIGVSGQTEYPDTLTIDTAIGAIIPSSPWGATFSIVAVNHYADITLVSEPVSFISRPGPVEPDPWNQSTDVSYHFNGRAFTSSLPGLYFRYVFDIAYDPSFNNRLPGYPDTSATADEWGVHTFENLEPATTYFIRVRAINTNGLAGPYHADMPIEVRTRRCPQEMADAAGNWYTMVEIGDQCWMAENLRTTLYANGDQIQQVVDSAAWLALSSGAWCYYENNEANEYPYGKLYNWYAVTDERGLCPTGWHVPTDFEWQEMEASVGMPASELSLWQSNRGADENVGGKLKSKGVLPTTGYWTAPNFGAEEVIVPDPVGFLGHPGGRRHTGSEQFGQPGAFLDQDNTGFWWTRSEYDGIVGPDPNDTKGWVRWLNWDEQGISRFDMPKKSGLSVRCVRD